MANLKLLKNDTLSIALKKEDGVGTVTGIVTDSKSGDPIEGAAVNASLEDGTVKTASTDSSGSYSLELTSNKEWTLSFSKEKYSAATESITVIRDKTLTLNTALEPAGNERDIYTEYLVNGGYNKIASKYTKSEWIPKKIETNFGDFDGNGIKDLLLYTTMSAYGVKSLYALLTIDAETQEVIIVNSAYTYNGGGAGGTESLYLKQNKTTKAPVLINYYYELYGVDKQVYTYQCYAIAGNQIVDGEYFTKYEYQNTTFNTFLDEAMQDIHTISENGKRVYVWKVNGTAVTEEEYNKACYFEDLEDDHPFAPYVGTYDEPIRPET